MYFFREFGCIFTDVTKLDGDLFDCAYVNR